MNKEVTKFFLKMMVNRTRRDGPEVKLQSEISVEAESSDHANGLCKGQSERGSYQSLDFPGSWNNYLWLTIRLWFGEIPDRKSLTELSKRDLIGPSSLNSSFNNLPS